MKVTIRFEHEDIEKLCQQAAARLLNKPAAEIEVTYGASYERSVTCTLAEREPEAPVNSMGQLRSEAVLAPHTEDPGSVALVHEDAITEAL